MSLKGIGWECLDWIHLAQNRVQCQAVVNVVLNICMPWNSENFLTSWGTVSSQEGLWSIEIVPLFVCLIFRSLTFLPGWIVLSQCRLHSSVFFLKLSSCIYIHSFPTQQWMLCKGLNMHKAFNSLVSFPNYMDSLWNVFNFSI
jgi:hypothetical protein